MLAALVALSTVVSFAVAQDNTLEVQKIQAEFGQAYIVPDLLESFDPLATLSLNFDGEDVPAGTLLTVEESGPQPVITLTPANSTVDLGDVFTLALVDPGAIGGVTGQQTRHWLVNGVTIGDDGALVIPPSEEAITPYGGPYPPDTDSAHRYVFLLYQQPESFAPEGDLANPGQPIDQFNVHEYAGGSGLGAIVAGSYFTCTRSEIEAITTTSAVDTATLPAADSDTSSGSSTRTSPNSPTNTDDGSAGFANSAPMGIAGILALAGFALA